MAEINDKISTYHMAENPALYEPSRNNAFRFIAPVELAENLVPAGVEPELLTTEDYLQGSQTVIDLAVAESSVPHFTLDTVEVRRGNSVMKFANRPSFSEGSLTCNDFVGARVKDVLLAWQALAYDVANDVIHTADNYKFDCQLVEYSVDYSKIIRTWKLKGCWVSGLSEGSFQHDSNDKRSISVTLQYDRAIPEIVR